MNHRHPDRPEVSLIISTKTFIKLIVLVLAALLLITVLRKASHALLLIFISFFLTLALNAPVYWISQRLPGRWRHNRTLATSISFIVVIILLAAFIASIVPPLVRQTESFINVAPHLVNEFRNQNSPVGKLIRKYHLQNEVNNVSTQLSSRLKNIGGTAFNTAQEIGSSAFSLVTILVLTFMMLSEGARWVDFITDLIPDKHHNLAKSLALDMYKVIKGFINGQVTLAAIASCLIFPALLILHVSYPVALLVIIFVCGLIPMIGHTIGAVIITIVALFHSTSAAAIILIYYLVYQQIENYFIQPKIQANSTNMSPLLVFMSVVVGISFSGLLGGLVAIPIAGCIRIIVLEYLKSHKMIDEPEFAEATAETK